MKVLIGPMLLVLLLGACQSQRARPAAQAPEGEPGAAQFYLADKPESAPGRCDVCGSITLVRFDDRGPGPVDQAYVDNLAAQLRSVYGLTVTVAPPIALPTSAYDVGRGQWDGSRLIAELEASLPAPGSDGSTVIALMNEDIYLSWRPEWRWAFGGRSTFEKGGGWAVISAFRMVGPPAPRRMMVMLGKYLGGIACRFPETDDPSSIMYGKILSSKDLDRMNAVACYRDAPRRE